MNVLIVGAGIAGLSLAALLQQRGLTPVVIEKSASLSEKGYMLGLYPIGANVLRTLHLYDAYLEQSAAGQYYEAYTDKGKLLKSFSFETLCNRYGPYRLLSRQELLQLLHQPCHHMHIRFNTEIVGLKQNEQSVQVNFNDKTTETYDLVIGADGIHSSTRNLILNPKEYKYLNTGWGGWVWWEEENGVAAHTIQEFWGKGSFFGCYPIKGKTGLIAAVPALSAEKILHGKSRKDYLLKTFANLLQHHPHLLKNIPGDEKNLFFWPLIDQRASNWHKGRVVLLGDAAAAFLPTAGIGASMALESAAVLNDILSRTGKDFIPQALNQFEKRRKKRVESIQGDSRRLAKMMFVNNGFNAWMRNIFTAMMPVESIIKSIVKGFDDPI